ncbi:MAG TPA: hypothetical protein DEA08_38055, partial [Planctomycetes bacterium]|nr:hypothetical protein [Planctomycetota bacterium]
MFVSVKPRFVLIPLGVLGLALLLWPSSAPAESPDPSPTPVAAPSRHPVSIAAPTPPRVSTRTATGERLE